LKAFNNFLWVGFLGLALLSRSDVQARCYGGGEPGPKPLHEITGPTSGDIQYFKTETGLKDFVLLEGLDRIVYRGDDQQIRQMGLHSKESLPVAKSGLALSRVVNGNFPYLLTEGASWFLDVAKPMWINFAEASKPSLGRYHHLFWRDNLLYTLDLEASAGGSYKNLQSYTYIAGAANAAPSCAPLMVPAAWHLGEGHTFPYAVFYQALPTPGGYDLTVFYFDVRSCRVTYRYHLKDPVVGPVKNVVRYQNLDAIAVSVDHPTRTLLWEIQNHYCSYYDLAGETPLFIDNRHPVIATFSPERGMRVIHLTREIDMPVLKGPSVSALRSNDLWLTNDGKSLFASPQLQGYASRLLMKVRLNFKE
jgi:hypothetical protein